MKNFRRLMRLAAVMTAVFCVSGCSLKNEEKTADLEFSVAADEDIPEALLKIINEKKAEPFKLTYSNNGTLYIVRGYGKQETGGYCIQVPQLYMTSENVVVQTQLIGPQSTETSNESYPYVVIKTDDAGLPVVFK